MTNRLRLAKLFGIEINLDFSWFVILFLLVWTLAGHYSMAYPGWSALFRISLATGTAFLFFGSILAHELGHSLVAISKRVPVKRITLFIFGGIAQISREPRRARDEFMIASAGPLVSLFLSVAFGILWLSGRTLEFSAMTAVAGWLGTVNLSLAIFNLIPGFPLDGGRILRSIVWGITGKKWTATKFSATTGQLVSMIFIFTGIWQIFSADIVNGLWIVFIGWFLNSAATTSMRQVRLHELLRGRTARDAMEADCPHVSLETRLDQLVEEIFVPSGRRCFSVFGGDRFLGILTVEAIKSIPEPQRPSTSVSQIMIPASQISPVRPGDDMEEVLERMEGEEVSLLPVIENQKLLGIVSREKILLFAHRLSEIGAKA